VYGWGRVDALAPVNAALPVEMLEFTAKAAGEIHPHPLDHRHRKRLAALHGAAQQRRRSTGTITQK